MARKEKPKPEAGGVPLWFLTYSDVITLLMTFFILLLTFASTEPENFSRMQAVVFGAGGVGGVLRESDTSLEKDSLLLRERPNSSRITDRGTETPPIHSDPSNESLANGLESIQEELKHDLETTRWIELELPSLVDGEVAVTTFGEAMARKMAGSLSKNPFYVNLLVSREVDVPKAIAFGDLLAKTAKLPFGRVGVGIRHDVNANPTKLRIIFSRIWNRET